MNNKERLLSSLDVFLLALIDSGVTTSYDMREQAGISVGASRPALQRLQRQGLVEQGKAEARNKLAFRLTRRGHHAKLTGLNHLLEESRANPSSEAESIVRIVALGVVEGRASKARQILSTSAEECRRRARNFDEATKEPGSGVAGVYRAMMALCSAAELDAFALALDKLASQVHKPASGRR